MRAIVVSGIGALLLAALVVASPVLAQGKAHGVGLNKAKGGGQELLLGEGRGKGKSGGDFGISGVDTGGLPPGLAKRDTLPPGLAKRDELPPGLLKEHATPPGLAKRDELPPGLQR